LGEKYEEERRKSWKMFNKNEERGKKREKGKKKMGSKRVK
jgi:hypothetical protein